jgi:hypothetical protein
MAAQHLRARASRPELQRYTLEFRNGELLRHQDPLALAQYRSDARLVRVHPEQQGRQAS